MDVASGASRSVWAKPNWLSSSPEPPGRLPHALGNLQPDAQHHQVEFLLLLDPRLVEVAHARVLGAGHLDHAGGDGPDVLHAVLVAGAVHVGVELLAERAHVHAEDGDVQVLAVRMLQGDHGLLGGAHAADGRAVAVAAGGVAAAHALDEGDPLDLSAVRGPLDVSAGGTGGREHAFELHAGQHVGVSPVAELAAQRALELLEAGGEDHAAGVDLDLLGLLVVAHRSGRAGLDALHALAAKTARQATLGLGDGLLRAVALVDLGEAAHAPGRVGLRHLDALLPGSVGSGVLGRLCLGRKSGPGVSLAPRRYASMASAALWPWAIASTMEAGPSTASPPANRPGTLVARVSLSATIRPPGPVATPSPAASMPWPMVTMTVSAARSCGLGVVELGSEPPLLVEHAGAGAEGDAGDLVSARLDPGRPQAVVEDDPFLERLGRLPGVGRHLRAALETGHVHRGDAGQPAGAARRVHGHVAAADDQHLGAERGRLPAVDPAEEVEARPDTRGLFAGDAQLAADPCPRGREHGLEAGVEEGLRVGDAGARLGLDAQVEDRTGSPGPERPWAGGSRGCRTGACRPDAAGTRRWSPRSPAGSDRRPRSGRPGRRR